MADQLIRLLNIKAQKTNALANHRATDLIEYNYNLKTSLSLFWLFLLFTFIIFNMLARYVSSGKNTILTTV